MIGIVPVLFGYTELALAGSCIVYSNARAQRDFLRYCIRRISGLLDSGLNLKKFMKNKCNNKNDGFISKFTLPGVKLPRAHQSTTRGGGYIRV